MLDHNRLALFINGLRNALGGRSWVLRSWLVLFLAMPLITLSQSVTDTIPKVPHAIKNTDISDYRKNTKLLVEDTQLLLQDLEKLEPLKSQLIEDHSFFSDRLLILKDSVSRFKLDEINRFENNTQEYNIKLNRQKKVISNWRSQINEKQQRINFDIQNWQLTKDSINVIQSGVKKTDSTQTSIDSTQTNILTRVNEQVEKSLTSLALLQDNLSLWNDRLIETENAHTVAEGEINEIKSLLSSKRKDILNNIWSAEYPPIWSMHREDSTSNNAKFKTIVHTRIEDLKKNINSHTDFYYAIFFSFVFILCIVLFLKIKSRKDPIANPTSLWDTHLLVKYPILSTFILLSFVLFIFFAIPLELKALLFLISIIPFAILLWELNPKRGAYTVGFFVFYCLAFISIPYLGESIILLRYGLLFLNGLSILLLLLLRNNRELMDEERSYWLGTLPFLIYTFIFINILAVIGNLIGNVQLAMILTQTSIGTFLAFAIIKESVKLVYSFLYLLIVQLLSNISNIIKDDSEKVLNGLYRLLKFCGYFLWLYVILGLLKIREILMDNLLNFITKPLKIGELSISLGNVIAFFLIIQLSLWISQFIRYFLDKEVYPRTNIDKGVASTFSIMIKYTLIVFGFMLALAGAGVKYSNIAIGLGALGVGIGFGLQNIVANFISGIILALERPIKIGDVIQVGDVEGEVKDIGMRACQIRSWEGADVFIPNGSLISGKLTNRTFKDRERRLDLEVKLALGSDIPAASQVALDAAITVPEIFDPYVNFVGVIEGASVLKVYGWVDDYSRGIAVGALFRAAVYQALLNGGFELPVPLLNVTINEKRNKSMDKVENDKKI